MIPTNTLSDPARRVDMLDALRGAALLGMFAYHLVWDLALLGFVAPDLPAEPGWTLLARVVAGTFLAVTGASLVLAAERGFAGRVHLRRLGLVGAAAAVITVATLVAIPHAPVTFGILHHIAAAGVLGLPFVKAPWIAGAAVAGLVIAAPFLVAIPAFDGPWLNWTGLGAVPPESVDYVPLCPWFAAVVGGILAARGALHFAPNGTWRRWAARGRVARLAVWAGRRSLWIYLAHQPVFLAVLGAIAWLFGLLG